VFVAFESYDAARSGAEKEARVVVQQLRPRSSCPPPRRCRANWSALMLGWIGCPSWMIEIIGELSKNG
jgi:hypothetical protein